MEAFEDVDVEGSFHEYQRSLRDRADDSIHEVRHVLERPRSRSLSPESPRRRRSSERSTGHAPRTRSLSGSSRFNDNSYKAAVDKLRYMLSRHDREARAPLPRPRTVHFQPSQLSYPRSVSPVLRRSNLPNMDDVIPVLQNQEGYIQQLEGQVKFSKGEFAHLKQKLIEITEENSRLHEELKNVISKEIIEREDTEVHTRHTDQHSPSKYEKLKNELERISSLHTAKNHRLEAQLTYTKEELERSEQLVENLKSKLRMQESINIMGKEGQSARDGICIKCAQNEAMVSSSAEKQQQAIDKLTRERDDLVHTVAHFKSRMEELKSKEEEAYSQVKKSIEMVDEAQLEKTRAIMESEQLRDQLNVTHERMAEMVQEHNNKMEKDRDVVRKECQIEMEELQTRLNELTVTHVNTQSQLDKVTRQKVAMLAELEQCKLQLSTYGADYDKATQSLREEMTQANLERNSAVQELNKVRIEMDKLNREREQEQSRLKTELENAHRRLTQAEKELMNTKEECITLTTSMQSLEREAHMSKMAKESIERGRTDEMKTMQFRAQQREEELNMIIEDMENKHAHVVSELEDMLNKQNGLVGKLREECRRQTAQIEQVAEKYRGDLVKSKHLNEELSVRLEKAMKRLKDMEAQHVQHGCLHEKMRQRLQQMDDHAQHSAQQILNLLSKQTGLMRDRQLLAKEVEFLRAQMNARNESDMDKLFSSHKGVVDDILENIHVERERQTRVKSGVNPDLKT